MYWLLATSRDFDLFTDQSHAFLFNPTAVAADLSQTTLRKALRWAVCLSTYMYICVQIPETESHWVDILSRSTALRVIRRLVSVPILSFLLVDVFIWPTQSKISATESAQNTFRPEDVLMAVKGL